MLQQVRPKYTAPDYDPETRRHYWVVMTTYRVSDPAACIEGGEEVIMDTENMVVVSPICCLHCAEVWENPQTVDCTGDLT